MAVVQAGFVRATEDIDLLVDTSLDGIARVRRALMDLPDQAVGDMTDDDLDHYVVVRVADEIVVDLMKAACGVTWADAKDEVNVVTIRGVPIPFANPALPWRTKQTLRDKDRIDRQFLSTLLGRDDQG